MVVTEGTGVIEKSVVNVTQSDIKIPTIQGFGTVNVGFGASCSSHVPQTVVGPFLMLGAYSVRTVVPGQHLIFSQPMCNEPS